VSQVEKAGAITEIRKIPIQPPHHSRKEGDEPGKGTAHRVPAQESAGLHSSHAFFYALASALTVHHAGSVHAVALTGTASVLPQGAQFVMLLRGE
jgi:hypothetical protein